ncbi:MAG: PQQ-dependent sugar dehydrogenase [Planctomycetota bacterium]|jgi:glucose/arabinose dehydrogenase
MRSGFPRHGLFIFSLFLLLAWADVPARADGPLAQAEPVAGGSLPRVRMKPVFPLVKLRRPIGLLQAGDGSGRFFVLEQYGRIMVIDDNKATEARTFLDIRKGVHARHNEEGLLSAAFHPDYATNGRFFVFHSAKDPRRGVLAEYRVSSDDPNAADPDARRVVLEIESEWGNHNGATILFGPDGMLYVSVGDGGLANDPLSAGQDLSTVLGSIMRIDVDAGGGGPYAIPGDNPFVDRDGARGEIWAYGLRNVWRMSFDRKTGELWAGDVGQNRWEEINLIVRGGNYGWKAREGLHEFSPGASTPADPFIDPVVEYGRAQGISVTGGYVYRGAAIPALQGVYLYADYQSGRLWGLRYEDGSVTANEEIIREYDRRHVTSFGEDTAGEVYVVTFDRQDARGTSGKVFRLVAE